MWATWRARWAGADWRQNYRLTWTGQRVYELSPLKVAEANESEGLVPKVALIEGRVLREVDFGSVTLDAIYRSGLHAALIEPAFIAPGGVGGPLLEPQRDLAN